MKVSGRHTRKSNLIIRSVASTNLQTKRRYGKQTARTKRIGIHMTNRGKRTKRILRGGFVGKIRNWWRTRKARKAVARAAAEEESKIQSNIKILFGNKEIETEDEYFRLSLQDTLINKVNQKKDEIYFYADIKDNIVDNNSITENVIQSIIFGVDKVNRYDAAYILYNRGMLGIVFRKPEDIENETPTFYLLHKSGTDNKVEAITSDTELGNLRVFKYNSLHNLINNYNTKHKETYDFDDKYMFKFIIHQDRSDNIDYFKKLSNNLPSGYVVSDISAIEKFNNKKDNIVFKAFKKYKKNAEYVFMVYKGNSDSYMAYNINNSEQGIPMNEVFFAQNPRYRFKYLVFFTKREHMPLPALPGPPHVNNNIASYLTGQSNNNKSAQKAFIKMTGNDSMKLKVLTRESHGSMDAIYPIRMPLINVKNTVNILTPGTGIYLHATSANTPSSQLIVCYKDAESNIKQVVIQPNTINEKPDYVNTPITNKTFDGLQSEITTIIGQANAQGKQVNSKSAPKTEVNAPPSPVNPVSMTPHRSRPEPHPLPNTLEFNKPNNYNSISKSNNTARTEFATLLINKIGKESSYNIGYFDRTEDNSDNPFLLPIDFETALSILREKPTGKIAIYTMRKSVTMNQQVKPALVFLNRKANDNKKLVFSVLDIEPRHIQPRTNKQLKPSAISSNLPDSVRYIFGISTVSKPKPGVEQVTTNTGYADPQNAIPNPQHVNSENYLSILSSQATQ